MYSMPNINKPQFPGPTLVVKGRGKVWACCWRGPLFFSASWFGMAHTQMCKWRQSRSGEISIQFQTLMVLSAPQVLPLLSKATKTFCTVNVLYQQQFIRFLSHSLGLTCLILFLFIWQLNFSELDRQQITFCASVLSGRHSKQWQMTP